MRVVVARRLPAAGLEELERRFDVDAGELSFDRDALLERVRGAAAIVADPTVPVDEELLDAAGPSLRIVANFAVGYDNVDLDACRARGVVVTNTPDVLTNATAELTVGLMLAAAVTLHASLTPETRHLVDERLLERFKPDAILVNTSRGALIDTPALVAALRAGRLAAAALDVYEHEPAIEPELLELENVVLVPHIGSATARARDAMARLVAENVIAVLTGRQPLTPVVR